MIQDIISIIFHAVQSLGMTGAFLSMMVENLGIPLPTEIGYLISQNLINDGIISYPLAVAILTLGHVSGAVISYYFGLLCNSFVRRKVMKSSRIVRVHKKLKGWYARYGNITVFATRFIGYVRPWSSLVAGFSGISFWPFLIWTFLGSLIFNIIALYFTDILIFFWRRYAEYHLIFALILLVLFFGLAIWKLFGYLRARLVRKKGLK